MSEFKGFGFMDGCPILKGMRFYTMISDDEYKILTFFKFNDDNKSAQFFNEETGEVETVTKHTLDTEYTLLIQQSLRPIAMVTRKDTNRREFFYGYDGIYNYSTEHRQQGDIVTAAEIAFYPYLTKSVFNNTVNYTLTHTKDSLTEEELKELWQAYVNYMIANTSLVIIDDKIDIQECLDSNDRRVPDSVIMDAEKELDTFILSYEIYEYDESVDFDKVNMKYFMIYNNDKYYIVLYIIDTARQSADTIQAMKENVDVIEFMLGKS